MQSPDGSMRTLNEKEVAEVGLDHPKILGVGRYFKIKRCYFKITEITPKGIKAKGVSRGEYYKSKRG